MSPFTLSQIAVTKSICVVIYILSAIYTIIIYTVSCLKWLFHKQIWQTQFTSHCWYPPPQLAYLAKLLWVLIAQGGSASLKVSMWVSESRSVCPTLCDPMDYTIHGILQARILEWVAIPFSKGFSQPRDQTQVSRIAGRFFTNSDSKASAQNVGDPGSIPGSGSSPGGRAWQPTTVLLFGECHGQRSLAGYSP